MIEPAVFENSADPSTTVSTVSLSGRTTTLISVPRTAAAAAGVWTVRPLRGFFVRNQASPRSSSSDVVGPPARRTVCTVSTAPAFSFTWDSSMNRMAALLAVSVRTRSAANSGCSTRAGFQSSRVASVCCTVPVATTTFPCGSPGGV
jgi:hypothetical protein